MQVVRVVRGVLPVRTEVLRIRDQPHVKRLDHPVADQPGDLRGGGIADVIAATLAILAQRRHLRRGIGEPGVLDLDPVLVLECLLRRVADVGIPVVDDELLLRRRLRCGERGGGRLPGDARDGSRARGRTCQHADRRRRRRCASAAGGHDRGERHGHAKRAHPLEELTTRQPILRHDPDELALQVDAGAVVSVAHDGSSSGRPVPWPRMRASEGDQVTATSQPTGSRIPVLGEMTLRASPPEVRS